MCMYIIVYIYVYVVYTPLDWLNLRMGFSKVDNRKLTKIPQDLAMIIPQIYDSYVHYDL
jgi:hypothetical protein